MRQVSAFAAIVVSTALTACSSSVTQGVAGGGTGGTTSTTTSSNATTGSTAGTGGAADGGGTAASCNCQSGERCDAPNACYLPPQPYYCVPCDQHPYCGTDGKIYDSDCAAIAAGAQATGISCAPPAGRYACGYFFCDASAEDCEAWSPVPSFPEPEHRCVPCAQSSGRACGDDGNVYPDACAMLQAGHRRGTSCPGFVGCGDRPCDTTVETCVMGFVVDCEGGAPTFTCKPLADAGP